MSEKHSDCIIIGAGLVGSAMGIALARYGLSVEVIDFQDLESQLATEYDGRASAISSGSQRILENIGVWEFIENREPILHIRVCDQNHSAHVDYNHTDVGGDPFGYIIENRFIRKASLERLKREENFHLHAPAKVEELEQTSSHVRIALDNGTVLKAPLLLVADGKFSTTRTRLGIGTKVSEYNQTAMVCTIAHEKPHNGLALERFMPAGPFAVLPMTDNRSNVVWNDSEEMAKHRASLSNEEYLEDIKPLIGGYLGDIQIAGPRFCYPLKLIQAERLTDDRIALIGDAAHGIHPIAGQGVNLGYRDVAVMAELVYRQAKLGMDLGSTKMLKHYLRWRSFDITTMVGVTDGLTRLFSNNRLPIKIARNLGMSVVNRMDGLKQFLMKDAMGLNGDLPPLMQPTNTQDKAA